jgi:tRNA pseudouridine32 synthase / 23S rRNA pseudouridine746 synthase
MPPKEITPEQMVSRLLYRDGLMLVIDKPAGFAVHRGPKGGESLEDHFGALRFGLPGRHRKALAQLGKLFKTGAIGKTYWAVVEGGPEVEEGQIELPLGRRDVSRGWWMKHDPCGQPAVTKWKVIGRNPLTSARSDEGTALTWLALEPLTGRTHQLRVHCAAMAWPIVGDAIYGTTPRTGGLPLHLHAREVVVPLYKNRAPIHVVAPIPEHMRAALSQCGWRDENTPVDESGSRRASTASP